MADDQAGSPGASFAPDRSRRGARTRQPRRGNPSASMRPGTARRRCAPSRAMAGQSRPPHRTSRTASPCLGRRIPTPAGAALKPTPSRWRRSECTEGLHRPGKRRTVSSTLTAPPVLPPGSLCSRTTWPSSHYGAATSRQLASNLRHSRQRPQPQNRASQDEPVPVPDRSPDADPSDVRQAALSHL